MTEELGRRLRRAADDSDRPLPVRPMELLARASRDRRRYRIKTAGATGTVLAAGALAAVLAAGAIVPGGDGDRSDREPAVTPNEKERVPDRHAPAPGRTVPLDLGPLSDADLRAFLEKCPSGPDPSAVDVEYARRVDWLYGSMAIAAFGSGGFENNCVGQVHKNGFVEFHESGGGMPSDLSADHPFSEEEMSLQYSSRPWAGDWYGYGTFRAIDSVDRVEVRVGTPGDPAPWRWAPVRDGWVYWGAWFADGTYDADDEVWLEWRAFDSSGERIDDERLPIPRHRLPMSPGEPYDPPGWG